MSPSQSLSVAVIGASGYTGAEVVRLLEMHPCARVTRVTSERQAGKRLSDSCPWLGTDLILQSLQDGLSDVDVIFSCQENGFLMKHASELVKGARIIDLSADFRLKDSAVYEKWYKREHSSPELLKRALYSVPELTSVEALQQATLLANPGCYPTTSLLALKPVIDAGFVEGVPVIDAKSGVSGAGRSRQETEYLFTEIVSSFKPYALAEHRHTPEIEQALGGVKVRFTPHLIPAARGICATIHFKIKEGVKKDDIFSLWRQAYGGRRFVRVLADAVPSTKLVIGSNSCVLSAEIDERTGYATLVSVTDNLVRGASGQAVQNMNLMFGFDEALGLPVSGVWP